MVPDYSQLSAASITSSTGLWCRGGIEATDAVQWILPDATILSSGNTSSNITSVSVCLQSVGLFDISRHNLNDEESLSSTGDSSLLLSGVYTCIVPFKDGRIERYYVWIVKENTPPVFNTTLSDCSIIGIDPFQSILTLSAGGQINNGAVTNYTCPGVEIAEFRGVSKTLSPTRMTLFKLFNISIVPPLNDTNGFVGCSAVNTDGNDVLRCTLKSISQSLPVITKAMRLSNDTSSATIEWSPSETSQASNLFYQVFARIFTSEPSDRTGLITGSIIGDTSAIVRGLTEYVSYQVIVAAFDQQTMARITPLPVVSDTSVIKPVQCETATGYYLDIDLKNTDDDICNNITKQNENFFLEVVKTVAELQQREFKNCSVLLEPKIMKFTCDFQNMETKTPKGSRIKIKSLIFCQKCLREKRRQARMSSKAKNKLKMSKNKSKTRGKIYQCRSVSVIVRGVSLVGKVKIESTSSYYCNQRAANEFGQCDCHRDCFN
ncbi:PREDICTED: uncharacterized protein LOC109581904 [Amphimedon queenslandica]|uniref:Fibronectin type-III domain-containing protein n=1 Tax=Amphimedon queenslandica TaxID=400682 RepID=A0AAN0J5E5_AMPQE|nr:PREDICTED: uncharacterized protein LOC109581904 [Amphimedon queenslandica]|eukprot:XP_019851938.1 PREDICTED: uncharacterized protein LOC109581904 [Amphimedon queenslandica]